MCYEVRFPDLNTSGNQVCAVKVDTPSLLTHEVGDQDGVSKSVLQLVVVTPAEVHSDASYHAVMWTPTECPLNSMLRCIILPHGGCALAHHEVIAKCHIHCVVSEYIPCIHMGCTHCTHVAD